MNHQALEERKVQALVQSLRVGVLVLLVLGAVGLGWMWISSRQEAQATRAFSSLRLAEQIEEEASRAQDQAAGKKDTNVDVLAVMKPEQKKVYVEKLQATLKEFPDTVAGAVAGLKLGRFEHHEGHFDAAAEHYRNVIKTQSHASSEHTLYRAMAFEGLGVALESAQKFGEAEKVYIEASAWKENPLRPLAYLGAARVLNREGKVADAKTYYEKTIAEFPRTEYEKQARALLALGTAAGKGA